MKVLVTGREGQLARSLFERGSSVQWVFAARPEVDLSQAGSLAAAIQSAKPDLVINAAAFTEVDRAETEEPLVRRINTEAATEGAQAAAALHIPFIQLSSDYVFDGVDDHPKREYDFVSPLGVYGRSKAAGEEAVLSASPDHVVVRTSWLIGPFGRNFAKTMIRLAAERNEVSVVDDQLGCPTSSLDLADALIALATPAIENRAGGIWHIAGHGSASWADLAEEVLATSLAYGGPSARVRRISSASYPAVAPRPRNSVLDCTAAYEKFGIAMPDWRDGVKGFVPRLLGAGN